MFSEVNAPCMAFNYCNAALAVSFLPGDVRVLSQQYECSKRARVLQAISWACANADVTMYATLFRAKGKLMCAILLVLGA